MSFVRFKTRKAAFLYRFLLQYSRPELENWQTRCPLNILDQKIRTIFWKNPKTRVQNRPNPQSEISPTSINFLDVTVNLNQDNSISTDLYIKQTDTHQYLLNTSAHPKHTKQSISYSLALRLRRICSDDSIFKRRTDELMTYLTNRGYRQKHVKHEIHKATKTSRMDGLKTIQKQHNDRTPFVVTNQPSLPQLGHILRQNYSSLKTLTLARKLSDSHLYLATADKKT